MARLLKINDSPDFSEVSGGLKSGKRSQLQGQINHCRRKTISAAIFPHRSAAGKTGPRI